MVYISQSTPYGRFTFISGSESGKRRVAFGALARELADKLDPIIKREADALAAAMKARVHVERGTLRNSIKSSKGKKPLTYWVTAGGKATTKDGYDYAIGTEFGTQHEHAQPFFWNTYRARRDGMNDRIKQAVAGALGR